MIKIADTIVSITRFTISAGCSKGTEERVRTGIPSSVPAWAFAISTLNRSDIINREVMPCSSQALTIAVIV